ncbi:hypothetical protein BH23GEM3_BH23GEM3_12030 [soil metagenome]|jgi:hypothetical protein
MSKFTADPDEHTSPVLENLARSEGVPTELVP